MFTLGMTANVAAAHRHEFSTPRKSSESQRSQGNSPAARSPFAIPPNYLFGDTSIQTPSPSTQRPVARREETTTSNLSSPQSPAMLDGADDYLDGGLSRSSSTGSNATTRSGRKRSQPRSRTSYYFAHPPPTVVKHRLSIRPRVLLQIQQLSTSARPLPTYDVLPSTIFAPRLARRYPKVFRGKDGLGANDVVVVSSEEYGPSKRLDAVSEEPGEEGWYSRDVLATICQLRKDKGGSQGKAEVCLNDGTCWQATPLQNGNYEFISIDEFGDKTTARWVRRPQGVRRRSSGIQPPVLSGVQPDDSKKFNFSIINPLSRRHPIIASLNPTTLDIQDSYTSSSSSSAVHPPTLPMKRYSMGSPVSAVEPVDPVDRALVATDAALRNLITVTAIWVSFRESWSPSFRYDDTQPCIGPSQLSSPVRSASMPLSTTSHNSSRTGSPEQHNHHTTLHHATEKLLRPLHRSTASNNFPPQSNTPPTKIVEINPRRANSTGSAFMAKRATRVSSGTNAIRQPALTPPRDVSIELSNDLRFRPTSWTPEQNSFAAETDTTPSKKATRPFVRHVRAQSAYYANGIDNVDQENNVQHQQQHHESKKRFGKFRALLGLIRRHQPAN